MSVDPAERVLSIQSHVVFGYVGGKAAVFPLQCLGYDVDVVNTVNFSNHSGYGRSGGTKTTAAELNSIFDGMETNELLMPTRLLTGYIPGAEALTAVAQLAQKLKATKEGLIYLLDPVMGDAGQLYVAADVIPVYKDLLPQATVITPNWFEVEVLTDTQLKDLPSLHTALRILHEQYHVPHVVISSIPLKPWLLAALPEHIKPDADSLDSNEYLLCISSSSSHSSKDRLRPSIVHAQCVPLIPGYFSGVGDLFSALLLAHFHPKPSVNGPGTDGIPNLNDIPDTIRTTTNGIPTPLTTPSTPSPICTPSLLPLPSSSSSSSPSSFSTTPLSTAASLALHKTHSILLLTHSSAQSLPYEEREPTDDELDALEPLRRTRRMRGRELALVRGQGVMRGDVKGASEGRELVFWDGFWDL
ncbi:hypothetical protein K443DRAFT_92818 [Laccaria amethystina LaAM-08-1]|uniref:pyridoxal kinase n=1 Tax=Laccaria amethystina LaAM-08-1 TaxID=1095629 RepID=A0A0C9WXY1_9AGAR|nr:hypothetical protein K443DRAFT_92818 [Laccaria amethystina LaAM-08-1]